MSIVGLRISRMSSSAGLIRCMAGIVRICTGSRSMVKINGNVALTEQLRFMYRGFLTRLHEENRLDMYIGFSQFYYLTNMGDLEDIIPAFTGIQIPNSYRKSCSSFVKIVNGDLLVAHNTWNQYALMLRFMKSYNYPSINSRIAASRTVFSARPGDL